MKFLLSFVRTVLGWVIVFFDYVTRPTPVERSPEEQERVENQLENMALYQFKG